MSAKWTGWVARQKAELFELTPYTAASLLMPGGTVLAALALLRHMQPARRKERRQ